MSKNQKAQNSDYNNYKKLALIRTAIDQELDEKYIRNILDQDYDIHYKLPANEFLKRWKPDLINHSALDFIAVPLDVHVPPYKLRILKVLLEYGANFLQQDTAGRTIIHKILDYHFDLIVQGWEGRVKDEIIDHILSIHVNTNVSTNPCDENGISHFHIACVANNVEAVELFLDNGASVHDRVHVDSSKYPGYTPLHFAARFHSPEVAKVLMKRNADLLAKDAKGMSPLQVLVDLAVESTECVNTSLCAPVYNREEFVGAGKMIGCILELANENLEINFMDNTGFTLLHAACAMTDTSTVEYYLAKGCDFNTAVHADSSMWAGYTALHFAARFKSDAFKLLLESGGDVAVKDAKGVTPFDLAVTRSRVADIHGTLLAHPTWKSIVLSDGKTKLVDLVWAMREVRELEAFLDYTNIDVNVIVPVESPLWPGHSILHVAVLFLETHEISSEYYESEFGDDVPQQVIAYARRIMLLMNRGADVNARDARGMTPWEFISHINCTFIASYLSNLRPQRVLPSDADADANQSRSPWESRVFMSILHGRDRDRSTYNEFMINPDQQKQMQEKVGLTVLHVACWELNVDRVREILKTNAVDVNAQIDSNFAHWPGCTPLHLLMLKYASSRAENEDQVDAILRLLLENGADVMLTDAANCTALHLIEEESEWFATGRLNNSRHYANEEAELHEFRDSPYTSLLLKQLTNFNLNITNSHGISHFHIACIRNDVDVIQQFLKHGVDVNESVDYFSDKYLGLTPLHLAMIPGPFVDASSRLKTVDVLLAHGADVNSYDSNGNTVLHAAAMSAQPREDVLEKLLSFGADINAKNIFGETALELLLLTKDFTVGEIEVFSKRGCDIYNFNPLNQKGYLSTIFRIKDEDINASRMNKLPSALDEVLDVTKLDSSNRTIIHNIISDDRSYIDPDLIENFVDHGCDIDHQDNLGRTALHVAVEFQNPDMVATLLNAGADVNIVDVKGESAFSLGLRSYDSHRLYVDNYPSVFHFDLENEQLPEIVQTFVKHVYKMQYFRFYVSDQIADTQKNALKKFPLGDDEIESFTKQLDEVNDIKFGKSTLKAQDFLSKSSRVMAYRLSSPEICREIDDFFKSDSGKRSRERLSEVFYFVKISYKQALERSLLLRPAADALQTLVQFPTLEICSRVIFTFLTTSDLKNLIAAIA